MRRKPRPAPGRRQKSKSKPPLIAPIKSLAELSRRCHAGEEAYQKLAVAGAENLGAPDLHGDWKAALRNLNDQACSLEYNVELEPGQDPEQLTVDEVNFCRDLI